MSNGKSIPSKSSRQGSGTATLMTHPSSPIYLPSGVTSLEEWLISLQQDSHANPTQPQDSSEGLMTIETSGLTPSELSVRWDHDGSYWKTWQVSFLHLLTGEDQRMGEPWLESLPQSGTVSIGKQSGLTMWAHPTDASGGGALLWRTPAQQEPGITLERLEGEQGHRMYDKETGRLAQYGLTQQAQMQSWPSPQAMDSIHWSPESFSRIMDRPRQGKMLPKLADVAHQENWMTPNTMDSLNPKTQEALDHEYTHREGRSNPNNLRDQVSVQQGETNWPTPDSSPRGPRAEDLMVDGKMQVQRRESGQQRGMDLQTATTHWPTPTATPYGTGNNYKVNEGQPAAHSPGLDTLTKNWATPQQRDHRSAEGSAPRWANPQRSRNLNDQVYSSSPLGPQVPQIQTHGSESSENVQTSPRPSTKRLNPSFVEWLMGLPIGWTSLQPMTELTD